MGVGDQMAGFAVNRDRHLRADHLVHAHELVTRGMAGDVDEVVLLGDDLDPEPDQRVLQSIDRLLVAGDDPRRENHDVAGLEHDVGWSSRAILVRAARGSPWLPVQISRILSRGM